MVITRYDHELSSLRAADTYAKRVRWFRYAVDRAVISQSMPRSNKVILARESL